MAGSRNQTKQQASNKRNTAGHSSGSKQHKKETIREPEEISYASEIAVWVICACMLIVELGNFGLCGFINYISKFFFGIFGLIEYILPLVIMFAAFFLHINDYKKRAVQKVIFGSCVLICVGMMGQMAVGVDQFAIRNWYLNGYQEHSGGGIVCGFLAWLLNAAVGRIGTYIIIVLTIILCVVLFAEISVIDFIKEVVAAFSRDEEEMEDEGYEEPDEQPVRTATPKKKSIDSAKMVREDAPVRERSERMHEKKRNSVLDAISVLPADADQGILPSQKETPLPTQEDMHEIRMNYVLNLPGENMGELERNDSEGEKKKKLRSKKDKTAPSAKAIVPTVLPVEQKVSGSERIASPMENMDLRPTGVTIQPADYSIHPEPEQAVMEYMDSMPAVERIAGNSDMEQEHTADSSSDIHNESAASQTVHSKGAASGSAKRRPTAVSVQGASEKGVSGHDKPVPAGKTTVAIEMENRTAEAVKNVAAKEIGTSDASYQFPPLELLKKGKTQAAAKDELIRQNAIKLQEVLKSFGVNVTMTNYSCGPSVTRYEMVPEQGVKVSKITGLADDIMMNLAAQSIRIEAPIPGKSAVGIEIPNEKRSGVGFRELIDTEKFIKHPSKLAVAIGKDIEGNVVVEDLAKMPHLLIAGATGSGKSVCTNTLIMSILYKARPEEVKLILVDPKQVELKVYNGIPHLLTPVVTDPKKAAGALNWAVAEMSTRYQMFSDYNVRNIQGYNAKVEEVQNSGKIESEKLEKMPQIVIIVDELADLMMVAKAEVEEAIVRLAQLARAAGIHLVIATQRPSVDVVTGLIKANVPSRIALSVSSGVDSRTIIDCVGAEKLLGNGDMLFYPTMYPKPVRVQGAYISDDEVVDIVEFLKTQNGETSYSEEVTSQITSSGSSGATAIGGAADNEQDEYFVQAGKFIIEKNKASIGMLQRMFKIGFNRAARIMDQLSEAGVVGPEEGTKPRQVLMSEEQFEAYVDEYF